MEFVYERLRFSVPDTVYQPAEDSFMLADAARSLKGRVLDIGCGCGIASLSCARTADSVLGTDINPKAVECAKANAGGNSITNATFIQGDLFSGVEGAFDAILFNPPYLPTADDEHVDGPLDKAFDGGEDGRQVLDRFLAGFDRYLRPSGVLLLVQSSLNGKEETVSSLERLGYAVEVMQRQDFFFEGLFLLKASKK
jgi:release factor glutamine methyltransferase